MDVTYFIPLKNFGKRFLIFVGINSDQESQPHDFLDLKERPKSSNPLCSKSRFRVRRADLIIQEPLKSWLRDIQPCCGISLNRKTNKFPILNKHLICISNGTDSYKRRVLCSKMSFIFCPWKFDSYKRLILIFVILSSGGHCTILYLGTTKCGKLLYASVSTLP